jgi:hypothetical protein
MAGWFAGGNYDVGVKDFVKNASIFIGKVHLCIQIDGMNEQYFSIVLSGNIAYRPPISQKVRTYFETFVETHVLVPHKIVIGGKWKIWFHIFFSESGPFVLFNNVALADGGPRTITSDGVKMYTGLILIDDIQTSATPYLTTIEKLYEVITLFFTTHYKKVKPAFMNGLWEKVDLDYLQSLPYPAPYEEQQYFTDQFRQTDNSH